MPGLPCPGKVTINQESHLQMILEAPSTQSSAVHRIKSQAGPRTNSQYHYAMILLLLPAVKAYEQSQVEFYKALQGTKCEVSGKEGLTGVVVRCHECEE